MCDNRSINQRTNQTNKISSPPPVQCVCARALVFFSLTLLFVNFSFDTPRRLRGARVTGVTCASSTLPILLAHPSPRTPPPPVAAAAAAARGSGRGRRGLGAMARGAKSSTSLAGRGTGAGGFFRGYDIVLLDECSQIVEPMSLLPLAVAQPCRLVLVGDPMQLPPAIAHARVRKKKQRKKRSLRADAGARGYFQRNILLQ